MLMMVMGMGQLAVVVSKGSTLKGTRDTLVAVVMMFVVKGSDTMVVVVAMMMFVAKGSDTMVVVIVILFVVVTCSMAVSVVMSMGMIMTFFIAAFTNTAVLVVMLVNFF